MEVNFVLLGVIGVLCIVAIASVIGILSRYKRCSSDELLVVFGRAGKVKDKDGNNVILPAKIIQGGGTFVWPIIQDWKKMSMAPLQIKVQVDGIDSQAIPLHLPVVLTTAISTDKMIQANAAARFLSADTSEITSQIKEILIGEVRAIMATMPIEDINANRTTFLTKVKESLEQELTKVGYGVTNINISELSDDSNYIKNLGKKAATKAQAQAEADIAEQVKQGEIRKAETEKEKQIAVAAAEKEKQVTVANTKQEQEVNVAQIQKEQQIKLAEAEKERESGVAKQKADQVIAIAQAESHAESEKANALSIQTANIAKAEAEAEAAQNEAEALKQIRIAKADQERQAETVKAIKERESKSAEYESTMRQKKAEQDKLAGVAEQEAKIDVANARAKAGKAEAESVKVAETAKVEAEMAIAKTKQERQLEVNKAQAKAVEELYNVEKIIPAQKAKEQAIIEAEAIKKQAELEAEAAKARILREAEAEAEGTRLKLEAEAEGTRKKLLAEAEGAEAMALAKAKGIQQEALAPAMAFERMIEAAGSPEMAVQWKMVDQYKGIAEAQANVLEHINMGQVTVYGDKNTGADFAKSFVENFAPALSMINNGVKGQFKELFKKNETTKEIEAPKNDPTPTSEEEQVFEDVD